VSHGSDVTDPSVPPNVIFDENAGKGLWGGCRNDSKGGVFISTLTGISGGGNTKASVVAADQGVPLILAKERAGDDKGLGVRVDGNEADSLLGGVDVECGNLEERSVCEALGLAVAGISVYEESNDDLGRYGGGEGVSS